MSKWPVCRYGLGDNERDNGWEKNVSEIERERDIMRKFVCLRVVWNKYGTYVLEIGLVYLLVGVCRY